MAGDYSRVAIIGAGGGIGSALVEALAASASANRIYAASRSRLSLPPKAQWVEVDLTSEASIERAADNCAEGGPLQLVMVATGLLHDGDGISPEKSWRALDGEHLRRVFEVNTIGPALVAKHFLPLLDRKRKAVFACLSARVGSISDNRLGGWYAYRASKAALNMVIKTLAVELKRTHKRAVCIGLHPGTVATSLSEPFQRNVHSGKLFTPEQAASQLLNVLSQSSEAQSGKLLAWDGSEISP